MKRSKLTALGILVALLVTFCSYVAYKHISWVNSVDGKEFKGTIVNLSSTMSSGKYPRSEEYVLVAWEDGSTSYFEIAPVHSYSKGDTWVTQVDQSYFWSCEYHGGQIPKAYEENHWTGFFWDFMMFIAAIIILCCFVGAFVVLVTWIFS